MGVREELEYLSQIIPELIDNYTKINNINLKLNRDGLYLNIDPSSKEFQEEIAKLDNSEEISHFIGIGRSIQTPKHFLEGYSKEKYTYAIEKMKNINELIKKILEQK